MDELDMHICLGCKQTIVGLDTYIQHKRYDCSAIKTRDDQKYSSQTDQPSSSKNSSSDVTPPSVPSDDFKEIVEVSYKHLSSLLNVVTSPVSTDLSRTSTASVSPCTVQPSVDLANGIVLYTTENYSFFDSLQLKSKTGAGKTQTEEKPISSLQTLDSLDCPTDKSIGNELPFLQQNKQLEQLCSLTTPALKIESDLFESADCNNVLTSGEEKIGVSEPTELCASKFDGDTLPFDWKSSEKETGQNNFAYDHSKALQIACMFNDLEFESDSDDFIPTDADDLLNFSDMGEDSSDSGQFNAGKKFKERNAVGGKLESYRHAGKLDAYARSQGKLSQLRKENSVKEQRRHTRGKQIATKWRPGERPAVLPRCRPHTSRGKWQGAEECEDEGHEEPDEGTDTEDMNDAALGDVETKKGKQANLKTDKTDTSASAKSNKTQNKTKNKWECQTCDKVFSTRAGFHCHFKSKAHKNRIEQQASLPVESENRDEHHHVKLECSLCDKFFLSKFSFARHLLSPFHARRAKYNEKHKVKSSTALEAGVQLLMQRLRRFQCRTCDFYTDEESRLTDHLKSPEHGEHVNAMMGPFMCVRCAYTCHNNDDMIDHVTSAEHSNAVETSSQPCILKEKRCKISCPKCDVVIHSASQLEGHKRVCTAGDATKLPLYKCSQCDAAYKVKLTLALHVRRVHAQERSFQCVTCDRSFFDKNCYRLHCRSKRHKKTVASLQDKREDDQDDITADCEVRQSSEPDYRCKQCDFVSDKYADVIAHRTKMHPPPDCTVCGLRFSNQMQHDKHVASQLHIKKEEESKVATGSLFTCDKCPKKFYTLRSMKMHEMNHQVAAGRTENSADAGPDEIERLCFNLKRESNLKDGKVECPKCGKFLTKTGILPHLRAHAGIFPFQCTYCGKKFVDAPIMRRHLKVHLGIRAYRCKFCGREFDRRPTLDTHLAREHKDTSGIVPTHLCNICGHKFLQLNQLNSHIKFHEKSVRCPHPGCTYSFRYHSEMMIHMRVHTKEMRYLCDECGYAGKTKTQLLRHRRVHTGERSYKCGHCSFRAAHIANLKRHERVHTGTKPYQCPHCKYACNSQENLRKHILKTRRHPGLPVYPCPHCEFGCNSCNEFQTHLEVKHSISRSHLPSIVAGLYKRTADARSLSLSEVPDEVKLNDL